MWPTGVIPLSLAPPTYPSTGSTTGCVQETVGPLKLLNGLSSGLAQQERASVLLTCYGWQVGESGGQAATNQRRAWELHLQLPDVLFMSP